MLKGVIFDMDGTIADTLPLCIAAFRKSIEKLSGRCLSDREIIRTFGPSEEGTIAALLPEQYDEGLAMYLKYYEEMHPELCPEPFYGIPNIFFHLRRCGLKTALVTGKGAGSLAISMRVLKMNDWFDCIETGNPKGPSKPESLAGALGALGIGPREALYVGDAASDVDAAREAGVPIVSAAWAGTADVPALRKKKPDQICFSVPDLKKYLFSEIA